MTAVSRQIESFHNRALAFSTIRKENPHFLGYRLGVAGGFLQTLLNSMSLIKALDAHNKGNPNELFETILSTTAKKIHRLRDQIAEISVYNTNLSSELTRLKDTIKAFQQLSREDGMVPIYKETLAPYENEAHTLLISTTLLRVEDSSISLSEYCEQLLPTLNLYLTQETVLQKRFEVLLSSTVKGFSVSLQEALPLADIVTKPTEPSSAAWLPTLSLSFLSTSFFSSPWKAPPLVQEDTAQKSIPPLFQARYRSFPSIHDYCLSLLESTGGVTQILRFNRDLLKALNPSNKINQEVLLKTAKELYELTKTEQTVSSQLVSLSDELNHVSSLINRCKHLTAKDYMCKISQGDLAPHSNYIHTKLIECELKEEGSHLDILEYAQRILPTLNLYLIQGTILQKQFETVMSGTVRGLNPSLQEATLLADSIISDKSPEARNGGGVLSWLDPRAYFS